MGGFQAAVLVAGLAVLTGCSSFIKLEYSP